MKRILAIDPGQTKRCTACCLPLELDKFNACKKGLFGRQAKCKSCTHELYYAPKKASILAAAQRRRATPEGRERERVWRNEYRRDNRLKRLLQEAKQRARRRGIEFTLEVSDLSIPKVCPVLGIPITLNAETRADGSPSLERIDSAKGYTKENTIVVSWRANRIKSDASLVELEKITAFYRRIA